VGSHTKGGGKDKIGKGSGLTGIHVLERSKPSIHPLVRNREEGEKKRRGGSKPQWHWEKTYRGALLWQLTFEGCRFEWEEGKKGEELLC